MEKLQATIELTGMQEIAEGVLSKVLNETIQDTIKEIVSDTIKEKYTDIIEEQVSVMLKEQLDNMIYNYKIQVGGDYFSNEPAREVTIAQLANEKVREFVTNQQFTTKDRWGDKKIKTFDEYVREKLNVDGEVKKQLNSYIADIRNDINNKIKDMFTENTRNLLSDSILNLLQQNETYKRIETNISSIASKNNEK